MTPRYGGNSHTWLGGFLHNSNLLIRGIPATALDGVNRIYSISAVRHCGTTGLTPSSYYMAMSASIRARPKPRAASIPNLHDNELISLY